MITLRITKVAMSVTKDRKRHSALGEGDEMQQVSSMMPSSSLESTVIAAGFSVWGLLPDASGWGKMNVEVADLCRSERRHSFRHRPSFIGPFRYAHRALIPTSDGRAWHHRQSSNGGTVLIDKSGSMSISEKEVLSFLHQRPMATVAIYEGSHANIEGTLSIIARANRYATRIPQYDTGNVIDGPALKWLARQEKPRIWVCDGDLTGVGDCPANARMMLEAKVTVKRAGIKQVRHLSAAPTAL